MRVSITTTLAVTLVLALSGITVAGPATGASDSRGAHGRLHGGRATTPHVQIVRQPHAQHRPHALAGEAQAPAQYKWKAKVERFAPRNQTRIVWQRVPVSR